MKTGIVHFLILTALPPPLLKSLNEQDQVCLEGGMDVGVFPQFNFTL